MKIRLSNSNRWYIWIKEHFWINFMQPRCSLDFFHTLVELDMSGYRIHLRTICETPLSISHCQNLISTARYRFQSIHTWHMRYWMRNSGPNSKSNQGLILYNQWWWNPYRRNKRRTHKDEVVAYFSFVSVSVSVWVSQTSSKGQGWSCSIF
jgi:hypothetical protein